MTTLKKRRGGPVRLLRGLGAVLVLVLLAALGTVLYLNAATAAKVTGDLKLPGLKGPVTVTRDQWGVPHIVATASDEDAVEALGFVHAQDRLWQMEFQRRIVQGRLSEVLGAPALEQDKFLRTWGFQRAAASILGALSPRSRALVGAYTRGVNAGIAQNKLPLEFRILGFRPEPWTETDSVSWSKLLAFDLGGNWEEELLGQEVQHKLGPRLGTAALGEILPPYPVGAPTILSADELKAQPPKVQPSAMKSSPKKSAALPASSLPRSSLNSLRAQLAAARSLGFELSPGKGSNDWVIGGARTESGKPILADDPHLSLSAPMLWYLADLKGPTLHAIGASLPGLPAIVIGRNDDLAWGVTNVNPDVQDLYIEPTGTSTKDRTEVIKVKGQPDVKLIVRESRHGPVLSGVSKEAGAAGPLVALRWTALDPGDTTLDAFLGLNYARNWPDFTAALTRYVAPSQNFVYADTQGNTGYYAPGRIPIRSGGNSASSDGSLPVPGDGQHEWTGFIPFAGLPHTYNPADHLIVTANNKVVPGSYPYSLGNERNWAEPYRAERITELLTRPTKLTLDDVKAVQLDTTSLVWRDLKPLLLATKPGGDLSTKALDLLRSWDGNERADAVPPLIFEAWLMKLESMAQDDLGDKTQLTSLAVYNALKSNSPLCAVRGLGDCAAWLTGTLKAAVTDLSARLGNNPADWTYGKLHTVASNHRAFGSVKALAWLFNRSAPTSGGTNTVNVARPEVGTFRQTKGPSYRQIVDLAHMNRSLFVGTLGQGGNPMGPHYADQLPLWQRGEYIPMSSDPADWGGTQVLRLSGE